MKATGMDLDFDEQVVCLKVKELYPGSVEDKLVALRTMIVGIAGHDSYVVRENVLPRQDLDNVKKSSW